MNTSWRGNMRINGCAKVYRENVLRIDHGGVYTTFQDKSRLRSGRVPVQLAHDAGFKLHRYPGDSLRNGQLFDSLFFAETIAENFPLGFLQFEFECWQFFRGQ